MNSTTGRPVACRLHPGEARRVHRLAGDEDLLAGDAGDLEQHALDVLTVDHDRRNVAIDRLSERAAEPVKTRLGMHPHSSP